MKCVGKIGSVRILLSTVCDIYIYISNKNIPVDIYFSVHDVYHQLHSESKGWKAKSQYSYCSIYRTNVKTMPTCKLIDIFAPSDFVSIFFLIYICFYLILLSILTSPMPEGGEP